ncbi:MAG: DNA alkylation repair protein [Clostridia bacterium]|nr:DNA alkylation repair protein [Clostridia bacterium]
MNDELRQRLMEQSENQFGEFNASLIPGKNNILGVRIPKLRAYAKELAKTLGTVALEGEDIYFEETMLRGMIIGYLKMEAEERLKLIAEFVPLIDNWAICDSFCSTLKFANKNREMVWEFIQPYINSAKEFEQRFGAVMLLDYFINEEYIDRTLEKLAVINTEAYYSSMAVAWTAAECYIKFPEKTLPYITEKRFDKDTHNRMIQKICDSYRVESDKKQELKKLKINNK